MNVSLLLLGHATLHYVVWHDDTTTQYNIAKFTTSTLQKNKEALNAAEVVSGVTTLHCNQRLQIMFDVDKLLLFLLRGKELAGTICEKALQDYNYLLKIGVLKVKVGSHSSSVK